VEAVAEVRSGGKITHDPFWPPRWRSSTVTVPSSWSSKRWRARQAPKPLSPATPISQQPGADRRRPRLRPIRVAGKGTGVPGRLARASSIRSGPAWPRASTPPSARSGSPPASPCWVRCSRW